MVTYSLINNSHLNNIKIINTKSFLLPTVNIPNSNNLKKENFVKLESKHIIDINFSNNTRNLDHIYKRENKQKVKPFFNRFKYRIYNDEEVDSINKKTIKDKPNDFQINIHDYYDCSRLIDSCKSKINVLLKDLKKDDYYSPITHRMPKERLKDKNNRALSLIAVNESISDNNTVANNEYSLNSLADFNNQSKIKKNSLFNKNISNRSIISVKNNNEISKFITNNLINKESSSLNSNKNLIDKKVIINSDPYDIDKRTKSCFVNNNNNKKSTINRINSTFKDIEIYKHKLDIYTKKRKELNDANLSIIETKEDDAEKDLNTNNFINTFSSEHYSKYNALKFINKIQNKLKQNKAKNYF